MEGAALPVLRERLAVPPSGDVSLEIEREEWAPLGASLPEGIECDGGIRLAGEGWLRNQRFVYLEVAPVRGGASGVEILRGASVRVSFEGEARETPRESDAFESLYARAFLNGTQSRSLREAPRTHIVPRGPLGTERIRLDVSREGIYRVTANELEAALGEPLDPIQIDQLQLTLDGEQVPFLVWESGPPDALFGGDDFVEFYGRPRLGEDEARVWEGGDFTDTNVYWLSGGGGGQSVAVRSGEDKGFGPHAQDFLWTERAESDEWFHGKSMGVGITHWFYGSLVGPTNPPGLYEIPLPGLNPASARTPALRYELIGRSEPACDPDHEAVICLGGDDAECVAGTTMVHQHSWDGLAFTGPQQVSVALWQLSDPTQVRVHLPGGCAGFDVVNPDWFEIDYPRAFVADGEALVFTPDPGSWELVVTGLAGPDPATVAVYEVSDPAAPTRIWPVQEAALGQATFDDTAPQDARYVLASGSGILSPDAIAKEAGLDLLDPGSVADLLILVPDDAWGASPALQDPATGLIAHRMAIDPGLVVRVTTVRDVLDQFSDGLMDPRALPAFLSHALDNWSRAPYAVLLVGDGSADYKNNLGAGGNLVPTLVYDNPAFNEFLGWYGSDSQLAAVRGDDPLPEFLIGRIAVRDTTELQGVVDKLLAYEGAPEPGPWRSSVLMTADQTADPVEEREFEGSHDDADTVLVGPSCLSATKLYYQGYLDGGQGPDDYKLDLLDELNSGQLIWTWAGHGNQGTLSNDVVFSSLNPQPGDILSIDNAERYPFVVHANCLTGQFMNPNWLGGERLQGMTEHLLKEPDRGAIAAFAPAGLTFTAQTGDLVSETYEAVLGLAGMRRFGDIAGYVFQELDRIGADLEIAQTALLGDPLARIAVPGPVRVTGLLALGGDKVVDLSWDANPPGDGVDYYNVYRRTRFADFAWEGSTTPGSGDTTYSDTNVQNGTTYWYCVTAVDAAGCEGPCSDPAEATPLRLVPPSAPTGITAQCVPPDRIDLSWDPAPPADEVDFWMIYYGWRPGPPFEKSRGPVPNFFPTAFLQPVPTDRATFLRMTATSLSDLVSDYSEQVRACGVPRDPNAATPPFLPLLFLSRAADDVVLEWEHVVYDVWGEDKADVTGYRVLRNPTPDFHLDLAAFEDQVACPCSGTQSWTDAGAAALTGARHVSYYLTPAVDAAGEGSGASHDLPRPVENVVLGADRCAPGEEHVSWDPVTHDMLGLETPIDHYEVYGGIPAECPLQRPALRAMAPLDGNVPAGTTGVCVTDLACYAVIAVDARGNWSPQ